MNDDKTANDTFDWPSDNHQSQSTPTYNPGAGTRPNPTYNPGAGTRPSDLANGGSTNGSTGSYNPGGGAPTSSGSGGGRGSGNTGSYNPGGGAPTSSGGASPNYTYNPGGGTNPTPTVDNSEPESPRQQVRLTSRGQSEVNELNLTDDQLAEIAGAYRTNYRNGIETDPRITHLDIRRYAEFFDFPGGGSDSGNDSSLSPGPITSPTAFQLKGPTEEQIIAAINARKNQAVAAAANGDPSKLVALHQELGIDPPRPEELKRAYYQDYRNENLGGSSITSKGIRDWFVAHDKNNDGKIQQNEMSATDYKKVKPYIGSDNAMSAQENIQYQLGQVGGVDAKLAESDLPDYIKKQIRDWHLSKDTNNDGKVSKSELEKQKDTFAIGQHSESGALADGHVSVDDNIAYHENRLDNLADEELLANSGLSKGLQNEIREWALAKDTNHDGKVSRSELVQQKDTAAISAHDEAGGLEDGDVSILDNINYHRDKAGLKPLSRPVPATSQSDDKDTVLASEETAASSSESDNALAQGINSRATVEPPKGQKATFTPITSTANNISRHPITASSTSDSEHDAVPRAIMQPTTATKKDTVKRRDATPKQPSDKELLAASGLSQSMQKEIYDWHNTKDTNNDGRVSAAELKKQKDTFALGQHEKTGALADGNVSVADNIAYHKKRLDNLDGEKLLANSGLSKGLQNEIREWALAKDTNHDGKVTKNELDSNDVKVHTAAGSLKDGDVSILDNINYHRNKAGLKPLDRPKVAPIASSTSDKDHQAIPTAVKPPTPPKAKTLPPASSSTEGNTVKNLAPAAAAPATDKELLAMSGLSTGLQKEISDWHKTKDTNRDGKVSAAELKQQKDTFAISEHTKSGALKDGDVSVLDNINYHQNKQNIQPTKKFTAAAYGGRGTYTGSNQNMASMPAAGIKPTSQATGVTAKFL